MKNDINIVSFSQPKTGNSKLHLLLTREISFVSSKFGLKEKESFYNELGIMLGAGIEIRNAFEIVAESFSKVSHQQLITTINTNVISGLPLYQAFEKHGNIFTKYECNSVRIGEETGRLSEVFKELSSFYKSQIKMRRQIMGLLSYPLIVSTMSIIIVYFMLAFVVPVFTEIFKQTGKELPDITKSLVSLSQLMPSVTLVVFMLVSLLVALHLKFRKKESYRKITSSILLKIPIIRSTISLIYTNRLCMGLKLLSESRVNISESLTLLIGMIDFFPLEQMLKKVQNDVIVNGLLFHEALSKFPFFSKKFLALIKLSEEVNEPALIYSKLVEQYSAEIEHQNNVIGKIAEPLIIVFVGLFVGIILIALYMPMFEMSNSQF